MAIIKAGAEPLAGLAEFLKPFAALVRREESKRALERYATGLVADVGRKTASEMGRALPGANGQSLQEFLTRTAWDAGAMDRMRVGKMLAQASAGQGALVIDDTGFAKKGDHSAGVARQYSGTLGRVDNPRYWSPATMWIPPFGGTGQSTPGCTCPRAGPATDPGGPRRKCRRRWPSPPRARSRWR